MLSGASVRYRFYTRWGVTAEELSRIVFSYSVTFWLGLLAARRAEPCRQPAACTHASSRGTSCSSPRDWLLMLVPPAYVVATIVRRRPLRIRQLRAAAAVGPDRGRAGRDLGGRLGACRRGALRAAAAGTAVVPRSSSALSSSRILLGMASHVPGGVGVFEGLMVLLLRPYLTSGQLLPALVVYRAVYYLLPLAVALVGLVADEALAAPQRTRREPAPCIGQADRAAHAAVLAVFTFLAGVVLLFSGATPAAAGRLELLDRVPAARRDRAVALPGQRGRRRAADPVAGPGPAARCGVLPGVDRDGHRHGRVAPEGRRLRGSHAPRSWCCSCSGGRGRRSIAGPRSSTRGSRRVDRGAGRRPRRVGVARALRVQARGVLERALVAVRAARRGVAVPACVGRRGAGPAAVRARPAHRPRAARGAAAD